MINWNPGFVTEAVQNGGCIVLDNINQAPSIITERLNSLVDINLDKNEPKDEFFAIPENPNKSKILINKTFRIICTCDYSQLNKMTPAFVNRFDVIVLENQFNETENEIKNLISILYEKAIINTNLKKIKIFKEDNSITNGQKIKDGGEDEIENQFSEDNEDEEFEENQFSGDNEEKENEENQFSGDNKEKKNKENQFSRDKEKNEKIDNQFIGDNEELEKEDKQIEKDDNENNIKINEEIKEKKLFKKVEYYNYDKIENIEIKKLFIQKFNNYEYYYNPKLEENIYKTIIKKNANLINKIYSKLKNLKSKTIEKFFKYIRAVVILLEEIKNIDEEILDFTYELLFKDEQENLYIPKKFKQKFLNFLNETKNNENYENDYFFKGAKSLEDFMIILYISSKINLNLCIIGQTGIGKTSCAKTFAQKRAILLEEDISNSFSLHTFNINTKPSDFLGSTTLDNGNIFFKNGPLTNSLIKGNIFIADEFNLSVSNTMKSIYPIFEQYHNEKLIIPGIEEPIMINNNFLFIACQNDLNTIGRNCLPSEIKNKVRTIYYPEQSQRDFEIICIAKNKKLYNNSIKEKKIYLLEEEARKCAKFMIKFNNIKQNILNSWSLRDINKLFNRIKYYKDNDVVFKGFDIMNSILFYILNSINEENLIRVENEIINLIVEVFFYCNNTKDKKEKINELLMNYNSDTEINFEEPKNKNRKVKQIYLIKNKCKILLKEVEYETNNSTEFEETFEKFNNLRKFPSFLNGLFKCKICCEDEPLLISGPTCYKTFLSKFILNNRRTLAGSRHHRSKGKRFSHL